jgi:hypothetical protein
MKYNKIQTTQDSSWQVSNSYMFRHRSANLGDSIRTKEYNFHIVRHVHGAYIQSIKSA